MTGTTLAGDTARAWVDIDLGALLRNGEALARLARVPLLPMVKADAYGLGATAVARALTKLDPLGFGVATVAEGRELRAAGVDRRIIVFTPLLPADFPGARAAGLTPTLADPFAIAAWADSGGGAWHLAVDTGMNRAGVRFDEIGTVTDIVRRSPPEGAFTHFHSSEHGDGSMEQQDARFRDFIAALPARPALLHADNSGAIVRRPASQPNPWSFVRPGVFLYGVGSGPGALVTPEPVVRVAARVVEERLALAGDVVGYDGTFKALRDTRVATLAIGYADGYRRSLGNRGVVLVNGARARVIGMVTMDMTMIDVTGIPCRIGDTVTLIGADGTASVTAEDAASACALSPYEILTGLRQRLPRRYT
ncbi:MAG: alanine racemase [Gemmatimonadales bacterium]